MKFRLTTGFLVLALAFTACGGDDEPVAESAPPPARSLVALGDPPAWVDGWAAVEVSNHGVPDAEASDVLAQVKHDTATRTALEGADLIVVALGAARVTGEDATTLEAIFDELDTVRADSRTALRLVRADSSKDLPNRTQCRLVKQHGGRCITPKEKR